MTALWFTKAEGRRKFAARWALLATMLLAAAACSAEGSGSVPGGATALPGPLPEGISFADPPEDAADAPVFSVDLVDGTEIRVSDLWNDRPLVLVFTSSWCEHCAEMHAELAEFIAGYDDAVALLAVAGEDDLESVQDYVRDLGLEHPVAMESDDAWLKYAVHEPPLVALVTNGGKVVRGWPGGVDPASLEEELEAIIERTGGS